MNPEDLEDSIDEDVMSVPTEMPSAVSNAIAKYGNALDAIGNELSNHNSILTRKLGNLRRIKEDLGDVEFLLGQMSENYQEALDDFESEERKKEARKKFVARLTSPFKPKEDSVQVASSGYKKPKDQSENKPWWKLWSRPQQPTNKLSAGGVSSTGIGKGEIIKPGIYDDPTQGRLAPGTAVVPLNRNYGKEILGQYDVQQYQQSLAEVLAKSTSALLGAGVAVYGSVLRGLGPLAGYFNNSISGLLPTLTSILGISRSAVIDLFGGPAYAGVIPNERDERYFYKSWRIYMDKNRLYFPGAGGVFGGGGTKGEGELAKDIAVISSASDLRFIGGTNVGNPPAWIPFQKADAKKIGYVSGFGFRWGRDHTGIDLDGDVGIKIISPFAGEVFDLNRNWPQNTRGGYGNLVGIKHEKPPIFTYYGHLQDVANHLQIGTKVKAGEVIGTLGNTGRSTGPHLHWEIRTTQTGGQVDPVEWTHQNKPGFQIGGLFKPIVNLVSKFTKPKGLSVRGVQAGFTGMAKEGFDAIMRGAKFKNPNKPSLIGKGSRPVLGHGAYSAPTAKGASRYVKPGGGIIKSIVPGGARRISFIEPQAVVKPETFDKGKLLADKLLKGAYSNSPLANKLRAQMLSGAAQSVGIGLGKTFGRVLPILNAPLIGDMLFPEPTAAGTLDYAKSQGWVTPETNKPAVKTTTIQMPAASTPAVIRSSKSSSTPQFVNMDIPTNTVLNTTQMRRM